MQHRAYGNREGEIGVYSDAECGKLVTSPPSCSRIRPGVLAMLRVPHRRTDQILRDPLRKDLARPVPAWDERLSDLLLDDLAGSERIGDNEVVHGVLLERSREQFAKVTLRHGMWRWLLAPLGSPLPLDSDDAPRRLIAKPSRSVVYPKDDPAASTAEPDAFNRRSPKGTTGVVLEPGKRQTGYAAEESLPLGRRCEPDIDRKVASTHSDAAARGVYTEGIRQSPSSRRAFAQAFHRDEPAGSRQQVGERAFCVEEHVAEADREAEFRLLGCALENRPSATSVKRVDNTASNEGIFTLSCKGNSRFTVRKTS